MKSTDFVLQAVLGAAISFAVFFAMTVIAFPIALGLAFSANGKGGDALYVVFLIPFAIMLFIGFLRGVGSGNFGFLTGVIALPTVSVLLIWLSENETSKSELAAIKTIVFSTKYLQIDPDLCEFWCEPLSQAGKVVVFWRAQEKRHSIFERFVKCEPRDEKQLRAEATLMEFKSGTCAIVRLEKPPAQVMQLNLSFEASPLRSRSFTGADSEDVTKRRYYAISIRSGNGMPERGSADRWYTSSILDQTAAWSSTGRPTIFQFRPSMDFASAKRSILG